MAFLGSIGVSIARGIIESEGAQGLADLLLKIQPQQTLETLLTSVYPVVDVELEKHAKETKTKVDDILVAAIKEAIEIAAETINLTLPNIDND